MKVNTKKLSALAAAGIVGLGMAGSPIMAADKDTGDTIVTYTSGASSQLNGKLLMVVPADLYLNKDNPSKSSNLIIRMADVTEDLPTDLQYKLSLKSANGLLLTSDATTRSGKYTVQFGSKSSETAGQLDNLSKKDTYVENAIIAGAVGSDLKDALNGDGSFKEDNTHQTGTQVWHTFTATVNDTTEMETKNGIDFKDTMTFKISDVSSAQIK